MSDGSASGFPISLSKEVGLNTVLDKRCVLITGKGGVGRSTVTGALALAGQRHHKRVLVTEIAEDGDDYSPLAQHFHRNRFPPAPEELAPGVKGVSLLPRVGQELFLRQVTHSAALVRAALSSETIRRLLSAGPSFREMGVYFQLLSYLRAKLPDGSPEFELIVVDMPATGHTLSLTGLPDVLLKLVSRGPMADALREGVGFFSDPAKSAAWVVTLPEVLPVSECLELIQGLERNRSPVGGVIVNRFPLDPFTPGERAAMTPLIERHKLFGAEGFHRVELSQRAITRLRESMPYPLLMLPEVDGKESALVTFLAGELVTARPVEAPVTRPGEDLGRVAP